MRRPGRPWLPLLFAAALAGSRGTAVAQGGPPSTGVLPPGGYGSLTQADLSLRVRTADIEVRFVPLDARVTRLLARDSWESLRSLVAAHRTAIDSVANISGVARPGLASVSFFGQSANARFDPQTLIVLVRGRELRPLGIVPFSGRFTSQQLNVREQVSGIYLYEEDLPVNDTFRISYAGQTSDDWQDKQTNLDRERARVALRLRDSAGDSTTQKVVAPDTANAARPR
jgi:hypothetical protein